MRKLHSAQYCRGQAMTEFVVMASGVLVVLFLSVPTLAKLLDMSFQTQLMARYLAWERTVWYDFNEQPGETDDGDVAIRTDDELNGTAQRRLLLLQSDPVTLDDTDTTGTQANEQHALWRWSNGQNMLQSATIRDDSLAAQQTPSVAYNILSVYNTGMDMLTSPLTMLGVVNDDDFLQVAHPLENYYTPRVSVQVNIAGSGLEGDNQQGFLPNTMEIQARGAILADGWNAQGDAHFFERTDDFAIGTMMDNGLVNAAIDVIGVFEPSFKDVDFGYVGIEKIPDADVDCDLGYCFFDD